MQNLNLNKHLGESSMLSKYKGNQNKLNDNTKKQTDDSAWDVLQINWPSFFNKS